MVSRHSVAGRLAHFRVRVRKRAGHVRFYGRFINRKGEPRGYEFQVRISDRLSRKALSRLIGHVQRMLKYGRSMPLHKRRETFSSFKELIFQTTWVRIRRIADYDVSVDSPRRV
jgi:hypothetical protein